MVPFFYSKLAFRICELLKIGDVVDFTSVMYIHISMKLFYIRETITAHPEKGACWWTVKTSFLEITDGRTDDDDDDDDARVCRGSSSVGRRRSWTNQSMGKLREEEESISSVFFISLSLSLSFSLWPVCILPDFSLSLSLFLSLKRALLLLCLYLWRRAFPY